MRSLRAVAMEPPANADPNFVNLMERIVLWMAVEHLASIVRAIECSEVTR